MCWDILAFIICHATSWYYSHNHIYVYMHFIMLLSNVMLCYALFCSVRTRPFRPRGTRRGERLEPPTAGPPADADEAAALVAEGSAPVKASSRRCPAAPTSTVGQELLHIIILLYIIHYVILNITTCIIYYILHIIILNIAHYI